MSLLSLTRRCLPVLLLVSGLCLSGVSTSAQFRGIFGIKNCQHETRIEAYYQQVKFFYWWYLGNTDLQKQKLLKFAPGYQPDTIALRQELEKFRAAVPDSFHFPYRTSLGLLRDLKPVEPNVIWFTQVYADKSKTGTYTVHAAYTITFEGKDGRLEENRLAPRIKKIAFILAPTQLRALAKQLETLPVTLDMHG